MNQKAVVSVVGKDVVGILAQVTSACAQNNINIIEVSQTVLDDYFCMFMMLDITGAKCSIQELNRSLNREGEKLGLSIHVMHEDIFKSMHRI